MAERNQEKIRKFVPYVPAILGAIISYGAIKELEQRNLENKEKVDSVYTQPASTRNLFDAGVLREVSTRNNGVVIYYDPAVLPETSGFILTGAEEKEGKDEKQRINARKAYEEELSAEPVTIFGNTLPIHGDNLLFNASMIGVLLIFSAPFVYAIRQNQNPNDGGNQPSVKKTQTEILTH